MSTQPKYFFNKTNVFLYNITSDQVQALTDAFECDKMAFVVQRIDRIFSICVSTDKGKELTNKLKPMIDAVNVSKDESKALNETWFDNTEDEPLKSQKDRIPAHIKEMRQRVKKLCDEYKDKCHDINTKNDEIRLPEHHEKHPRVEMIFGPVKASIVGGQTIITCNPKVETLDPSKRKKATVESKPK